MKKRMALVMVLVLTLMLCACGAGEDQPKGLQAGFGREVIMPETPNMHINGTDTAGRVANGFLDYVQATCIALKDEAGTVVLVFTIDMLGSSDSIVKPLVDAVSKETGVAPENIMMAATHSHSAPSVNKSYKGGAEYHGIMEDGAVKAAKAALEDLSYAEMSYGSTEATGLLFVRHYVHADGKVTAASGIRSDDIIVGHPTEADEQLQILRLTRPAEGKKDILMLSWNSHPTFHGGVTDDQLSADFPGPTRDYIESQGDYLVAYFTGDAGNQAPTSAIAEENHGLDYREFGEKLAKYCLDALPTLTPAQSGLISISAQEYPARANKERLDMLAEANEVSNIYNTQGRDAANALAEKYGLYQFLEANAIIARTKTAETVELDIRVMSIGSQVSMLFAPYEMFSDHGRQLRAETPYDITLLSSCSNGADGYIPSAEAYEYGCYESYVSRVAPGTGEELVTEYLKMLTDMQNGQ